MSFNKIKAVGSAVLCSCLLAGTVSASTGYVNTDLVNVRTEPSIDSDVYSQLEGGEEVLITYGPDGGWCEIYYDGDCYYVCSDFISMDGSGPLTYHSSSSDDEYYDEDSYYEDSYSEDSWSEDSSTSYSGTESSSAGGTYLGTFTLTGYCNCAQCCGTAGNATASGVMPSTGHTVAMGGVPFGTQLLINGTVYTVEDRGTPYGHVDIYFGSHQEALSFGLQSAEVYQLN